ncbi:unnamed protein product, partial [Symbiodinium sp. CCMP2456]
YVKLRKLRTDIERIEKNLDDQEEDRSSSFSSGSPLLPPSDSDGECGEERGKDDKGDTDAEPKAGGSLAKPPPVPAKGSGVKHPPKVKAGAQTAKAAARRDPGAPNHMGHPNAAGDLYPGFPT